MSAIAENERLRSVIRNLNDKIQVLTKERDRFKKDAANMQSKASLQAADIERLKRRLDDRLEQVNRLNGVIDDLTGKNKAA